MSRRSRFDGKNFYEVLQVPQTASVQEIRRAYRSLAIKCHPDKHPDDEQATADFQALTRIVDVLCDPQKRKFYDLHGTVDDDFSAEDQKSYEYWRERFHAVTKHDIEEFEKTYKGSATEKEDVLAFYAKFKGNIEKVMAWVPLSSSKDISRFADIITSAIANKEVQEYKKFHSSLASLNIDDDAEAEEAKVAAQALGLDKVMNGSQDDLKQLILTRRQKEAGSFLEEMTKKYTKPGKRKADSLPSEEEFLQLQKEVEQRRRDKATSLSKKKKPK
jgi:DnaJ family protein C protein 9